MYAGLGVISEDGMSPGFLINIFVLVCPASILRPLPGKAPPTVPFD
jgi:hypothetical protein